MFDPAAQFWPHCGYELLEIDAGGRLVLTDDYLRHLLSAPELAPIHGSCERELALHQALLNDPKMAVSDASLAELEDADAGANYGVWLRFRGRLLAHPTLEAAYWALFQGAGVDVAPALVHQLTEVLVRHVLGQLTAPAAQGQLAVDAFWGQLAARHPQVGGGAAGSLGAGPSDQSHPAALARAGELLFRPQKITIQAGPDAAPGTGQASAEAALAGNPAGGHVMAADVETVERHATAGGFGSLGELLRQGGAPLRSVDLDVLTDDNLADYWARADRRDWVLALSHGQNGLIALCRVLEAWVAHFCGVLVAIAPAAEIDEERWVWHVGLDAEASGVLNALYKGDAAPAGSMERMLCLFTCEFANPMDAQPEVRGHPVYLAMAMDANNRLKLKPQNLLLNLPLAKPN